MSSECCGSDSSRGWLDWTAITVSIVCGIHCLVTPLVLVALPFLGQSLWVDEDFHFWMLLLVIPTTTLAVLSGCRKHKDRWVVACSLAGVLLLASALWMDAVRHSGDEELTGVGSAAIACQDSSCCEVPADLAEAGNAMLSVSTVQLVNVLGGLFLVFGHFRNFRLCRKDRCSHGLDQ